VLTARAVVIEIGGGPAIGKTTLAASLERRPGVRLLPEVVHEAGPRPALDPATFFDRQARFLERLGERLGGLLEDAATRVVLIDQGACMLVTYARIYGLLNGWDDVWTERWVEGARRLSERMRVAPDALVYLGGESSLHRERAGADDSRRRRNLELNLRVAEIERPMVGAIARRLGAGGGVAVLEGGAPAAELRRRLLERLAAWQLSPAPALEWDSFTAAVMSYQTNSGAGPPAGEQR
jgi:hypothetical protein